MVSLAMLSDWSFDFCKSSFQVPTKESAAISVRLNEETARTVRARVTLYILSLSNFLIVANRDARCISGRAWLQSNQEHLRVASTPAKLLTFAEYKQIPNPP